MTHSLRAAAIAASLLAPLAAGTAPASASVAQIRSPFSVVAAGVPTGVYEPVGDVPPEAFTFVRPDGSAATGREALAKRADAALVMWAPADLRAVALDAIRAYQARGDRSDAPAVLAVFLPSDAEFRAIAGGGFWYGGVAYGGIPDLLMASDAVALSRLSLLGLAGREVPLGDDAMVLAVKRGNPKSVTGVESLARGDVRPFVPDLALDPAGNRAAQNILRYHGILGVVANGKLCADCNPRGGPSYVPPDGIRRVLTGYADAALVWRSDIAEALNRGEDVEEVDLSPVDGRLARGAVRLVEFPSSRPAADDFVSYAVAEGQSVFLRHGLLPAGTAAAR